MFDKDYSPSSRFMEIWQHTEEDELVPRMLITSNRHQMGKTASMIRIMEKVQEAHGRKFSIDDCCLDILEFMRRQKAVPEWTPLGLDEPQRGSNVGNKTQFSQDAQDFVEDLQTKAFRHVPALFSLPHNHFLSVAIYLVATSQIIKLSRKDAELFEYERDQLNRTGKTLTWKRGHFTIDRPYAWDWKEYMDKREKFDRERGTILEARVAARQEQASSLTKEQVYLVVAGNPHNYEDHNGNVSQSIIEAKLGVSQAKANYGAVKYRTMREKHEEAEKEA